VEAAVAEHSGKLGFADGGRVYRRGDYEGRVLVNSFSIDDLAGRYGVTAART
jgi:hypothetical protein